MSWWATKLVEVTRAIQFVTSEDHNPQDFGSRGTVLVLGEAREARSSKPATKVSDSEQTDYNKAILCCCWSHSWSRMVGWQNEAPCWIVHELLKTCTRAVAIRQTKLWSRVTRVSQSNKANGTFCSGFSFFSAKIHCSRTENKIKERVWQ